MWSRCLLFCFGLVFVHFVALHHVGSNNPDGIEIKKNKDENGVPKDGILFNPYYTVHDIHATVVFLFLFCAVVFFAPEMGGYFIEKPNFEVANLLKTPEHIAPVWYYTPYYAMLRAATFPLFGLDAKFWGLVVMAAAVVIPAILPWLDRSPVKSMRYKGKLSRWALRIFVVSFLILGVLGVLPPTKQYTILAQFCTMLYFAYFVLMPWYTRVEQTFARTRKGYPMKKLSKSLQGVLTLALLVVAPVGWSASNNDWPMEEFEPDLTNLPSLQNGLQLYVNYCLGCHGLQYQRYGRTADDLGIPRELALETVVFTGQKIGELMTTSMDPTQAMAWSGAAPPDLTLEARLRSPEWIYNYLKTFM